MLPGRYLAALVVAAGVAFGLFWVMQSLIDVQGKLEENKKGKIMDFVRVKRDTETETKKRELPDRKPPEKEPPPPQLDLAQNLRPDAGSEGFAADFDSGIDLAGGPSLAGVGAADTDAVPLVRVPPEYPMRAARRGTEGWVEVQFTISKSGAVKDPQILAYQPNSVFNRAALRAIRQWKYNPKMLDGKAVERPGVIVRLDFTLDK